MVSCDLCDVLVFPTVNGSSETVSEAPASQDCNFLAEWPDCRADYCINLTTILQTLFTLLDLFLGDYFLNG